MKVKVKIPQQGLTVEEVLVSEFVVAVGDHVTAGQPIMNIESEKAELQVEAPVDGIVTEFLVEEGDDAAVGQVVAVIERD